MKHNYFGKYFFEKIIKIIKNCQFKLLYRYCVCLSTSMLISIYDCYSSTACGSSTAKRCPRSKLRLTGTTARQAKAQPKAEAVAVPTTSKRLHWKRSKHTVDLFSPPSIRSLRDMYLNNDDTSTTSYLYILGANKKYPLFASSNKLKQNETLWKGTLCKLDSD